MKIIVVEGIGDIVSKPTGYGSALRKLKIDIPSLRVVFCDLNKNWSSDVIADRKNTIKWIKSWDAEYLDKTDGNQLEQYGLLLHANVDAVIIATPDTVHIKLARYWLQGNCERIFIEKPITSDLQDVQHWLIKELYNKEADIERVIAFDHYRPRVHEHLCTTDKLWFLLKSVGRIQKFKFYFLEDHSGTDKKYLDGERGRGRIIEDRNGPIENEGRVPALKSGLILDLLSHVFAVLEYFGLPESIKLQELRPAIYAGVDYDENIRALINNETFAAIKFRFKEHGGYDVEAEAYIGKGIRGSNKYPEMKGNTKVLEIEGETGNKLEFNFRKHEINIIENGQRNFFDYLERDPYYFLLKDIAFKRSKGGTVSLSIEMAAMILEKLVEIQSNIDKEKLATYRLGDKSGNFPPLLEDLLEGGANEILPIQIQ